MFDIINIVSRHSGAVAVFINDWYGLNIDKWNNYKAYNAHVYSLLMNAAMEISNA